jgi:putative acetyltransferase
MNIRVDDLSEPEVIRLLEEHLRDCTQHSPPESCHALDVEGLKRPEVTFWSVWEGGALVGCGALKERDAGHGEIKSMRTAGGHQRKGVAAALLEHILNEARRRSFRRISLETGSGAAFEPARRLYARFGFKPCGPFAEYVDDRHSVFMTREV